MQCNRNNNWAYNIKTILDSHGMSDIWLEQFNIEIPLQFIKTRLYDMYYQRWHAEINNSSRLRLYSMYKYQFEFASYLDLITEPKYRYTLSRFRLSCHNLAIESGRFDNTRKIDRLCSFCSMNVIENEYHFLLCCPFYSELRRTYLKPYFCRWPSINKFINILTTTSKDTQLKLAKFIHFALKKRNDRSN